MNDLLHINWTACDGRGLCTELLEGLDRDEWGYPLASAGTNVLIAASELSQARDAVNLCPRQALSLRREDQTLPDESRSKRN